MTCLRCGSQVPDGALYCQECGASQAPSPVPIPKPKSAPQSRRICRKCGCDVPWYSMTCRNCKQYYGASLTLIIIIFIVISVVGTACYLLRSPAEKKSDNPIKVVSYEVTKQSKDDIIIIEYEWKNTTDSTASFSWEYIETVFQDGIECQSTYLLDEDTSASTEIQPGKTYRFKKAYKLHDKVSDVQVTAHKILHKGKNVLDYTIHIEN